MLNPETEADKSTTSNSSAKEIENEDVEKKEAEQKLSENVPTEQVNMDIAEPSFDTLNTKTGETEPSLDQTKTDVDGKETKMEKANIEIEEIKTIEEEKISDIAEIKPEEKQNTKSVPDKDSKEVPEISAIEMKETATNEDSKEETVTSPSKAADSISPEKEANVTYANAFEKFLMQAQKPAAESASKSKVDTEPAPKPPSKHIFDPPPSEETSNSSWYKLPIDGNKEESMDVASSLIPPDESSNLSVPDNVSVVSSNIGDSCLSFQENMEESSNLSAPDDSNPVPMFKGHPAVFDESANMNPPSNITFIRPDTPNSITADATSSETTPVKRPRRGTLQIAAEDASEHGHDLTASDIFEYQWPQEQDAEFHVLQEQICIFLDIKSFKRKYPDLFRRVCDKHEKDYLRDKGVVSETQSDLGLTALKSEEVHDLMSKDYPAKYKEFLKVLHEREKQRLATKHKEYEPPKLDNKEKILEYTKKAMLSSANWNKNLLKERNEERRAYFDMQTFTFQYPRSKFRKVEDINTNVTAYPLSLIPGQFQDYCRKYTSEELKYFPLNKAIFDPPKKVDPAQQQQQEVEETESQEEEGEKAGSASESDSDEDSSSSDSDSEEEVEGGGEEKGKEKSTSRETSKEKSSEPTVKEELSNCRICKDEPDKKVRMSKMDEELITCSECQSQGHPSCLDLTGDMVKIIKTYPWQCMECKTCVQCMDANDEDKMLFCDKCDRGYHTFCVGLKSLPTGKWECMSCRGDTTPVKALPRPTPKAKRGRKPGWNLLQKQTPKGSGDKTPKGSGDKTPSSKHSNGPPKPTPTTARQLAREEMLKEKAAANEAKLKEATLKETAMKEAKISLKREDISDSVKLPSSS